MEALRKESKYTYADYCTWDDGTRWELIDGVAYAMAPAPSMEHQSVSSGLHGQLWQFLRGKQCQVFQDRKSVV
jgi:Uma2 family endonuclease